MIKLYVRPSNKAAYIQADDGPMWDAGDIGTEFSGDFAKFAQAWAGGDWEPGESNGQPRTIDDDLIVVATWDARHGVRLLLGP